jgi:hypothetical protein
MMDPWRTSTYSGNGGQNCVEVAGDGDVLIRDTKDNGQGPVLHVSPEAWTQFTATIK